MKLHQAGRAIIIVSLSAIILASVCYGFFIANLWWVNVIFFSIMILLGVLIVRFFRVPYRIVNRVDGGVLSPADGTIVSIGPAFEYEYFKDERIRVSIFMSINNVHVNSYPIDGKIEYIAYHPGRYMLAKLPKSSIDNEHNSIVVAKDEHEKVLFRQIAGFIARRIISYPEVGDEVKQGDEVGMIKFGSRVDVFLPLDAQIAVQKGDKVVSKKTVLAYF
ncbi:MAG: phosphatidylserine decarboxylase family protein [Bacteroidales bacterium]|nr:phosphatidylserine decarboxylase family protein [Bacteroidales bacterium]